MKGITFITPSDAEYGFRLAGAEQHTVRKENAKEVLLSVMDETETGLVIIDERLVNDIGEETLRDAEQRAQKVLLVLPAPQRPGGDTEDYVTRLIKRAIGYHVVLRI